MATLRISLIQTSLHWEDKTANLRMLEDKILTIPSDTELVILPEMFSTGFTMNKEELAEKMDGPTVLWMQKIAFKKRIILVGSMIAKEETDGNPVYYNRMIWMLPTGEFGYYDKRHLFAYGKENLHYSPGKKRLIASAKGWKINLQVCYDLRFPVWLRQSSSQTNPDFLAYDLLIVVANWPASRNMAWKTLLQARAIENQCYVAGVNRTGTDGNGLVYGGESAIFGPLGDPISILNSEETIISHTLDRQLLEDTRTKFPFWRDADTFFIQP